MPAIIPSGNQSLRPTFAPVCTGILLSRMRCDLHMGSSRPLSGMGVVVGGIHWEENDQLHHRALLCVLISPRGIREHVL